jgi:predicted permease
MQSVLTTVAPVFGLIALGFAVARYGYLPEAAGKGLSDFVFLVAIPALLFRTMLDAETAEVWPFALWASYYGAVTLIWLIAGLLTRWPLRRPATDGASIAMAAGFGNIVMMGLPLALDRFGAEAAAPAAVIISNSSPLLWFAGTLHIELAGRRRETRFGTMLRELLVSLVMNPIINSLVAGSLWPLTGLGLTPALDKILLLLGLAAVPGSLISLGVGLAAFRLRGQAATVALIVFLCVVATPAVAWVLAFDVFELPPVWAGVTVLLAACPPGVNAFLFAMRYDAAVGSVSAAVAIGTALSAITISVVVLLLEYRMY